MRTRSSGAAWLLTWIVVASALAAPVSAAPNDWAEGAKDNDDGASRDYYNRAASLEWRNKLGDWHDAKGNPRGDLAYVAATPREGKFVDWDVTTLVREWEDTTFANLGFFLRLVEGKGDFQFASREDPDAERRPQLVLAGDSGSVTLSPRADTYLEASTVRSMGHSATLRVSGRPNHALLRFDLVKPKGAGKTSRAVLRLFNTARSSGPGGSIGVFRCSQGHDVSDKDVIPGLAAGYPGDRGIGKDRDVLFFTDFESKTWPDEWSAVGSARRCESVEADADRKFAPWQGKALRAHLARGESTALNTLFDFAPKRGSEPEEAFFRYYLRLGDDWNQTLSGGKLPGFSGTYNKAGWGGRKVDGTNGWSARGSFARIIPEDNPLAGLQPIGTYCYHADMTGTYGSIWTWTRGYRGFLEKNRWYCIEQQVKLNAPDSKNGVFRAWVDGRLAFVKTDLRFRTVDRLKIQRLWMNVYHGGTKPSPHDQHLYIDNVVIAKKYIGPMRTEKK